MDGGHSKLSRAAHESISSCTLATEVAGKGWGGGAISQMEMLRVSEAGTPPKCDRMGAGSKAGAEKLGASGFRMRPGSESRIECNPGSTLNQWWHFGSVTSLALSFLIWKMGTVPRRMCRNSLVHGRPSTDTQSHRGLATSPSFVRPNLGLSLPLVTLACSKSSQVQHYSGEAACQEFLRIVSDRLF